MYSASRLPREELLAQVGTGSQASAFLAGGLYPVLIAGRASELRERLVSLNHDQTAEFSRLRSQLDALEDMQRTLGGMVELGEQAARILDGDEPPPAGNRLC